MNDAAELTTNNRFDAVDAETLEVLKGRVCETSRNSYEPKNITFLVWIFDNREDHGGLVKPRLLGAMEAASHTDRARRTKAGRPSKQRDALRAVCRSWLKKITPDDPETHPVELGALTFKTFTRYLGTFKKQAKNSRSRSGAGGATVLIRLGASAFDVA